MRTLRLSGTRVGLLSVLTALTIPVAVASAAAQNDSGMQSGNRLLSNAAYEVASIRLADPNDRNAGIGTRVDGTFYSRNLTLRTVLESAYDLRSFQLEGGAPWLDSERYNLEAKPEADVEEQLLKLDPKQRDVISQRMLQELLADRLKLRVHFETREMPVLALVVAKGGVKMHRATPENDYVNGLKRSDGKPLGPGTFHLDVSKRGFGRMTAQAVPIEKLVMQLNGITGHVVSNKTGLAGLYDFTLEYSDDQFATPESGAPSLSDALREQLGLKLDSTKGPVQVLVIDHVERPSEN